MREDAAGADIISAPVQQQRTADGPHLALPHAGALLLGGGARAERTVLCYVMFMSTCGRALPRTSQNGVLLLVIPDKDAVSQSLLWMVVPMSIAYEYSN